MFEDHFYVQYVYIGGFPGVVDGGCLPLVIGGSGVDQGGVGGPGTPPSGRPWSEDHFFV